MDRASNIFPGTEQWVDEFTLNISKSWNVPGKTPENPINVNIDPKYTDISGTQPVYMELMSVLINFGIPNTTFDTRYATLKLLVSDTNMPSSVDERGVSTNLVCELPLSFLGTGFAPPSTPPPPVTSNLYSCLIIPGGSNYLGRVFSRTQQFRLGLVAVDHVNTGPNHEYKILPSDIINLSLTFKVNLG